MSPKLSYLRLSGYLITITLHLSNMIVLADGDTERVKDTDLKYFIHFRNRYFTVWTFVIQTFHALLGVICEVLILKNVKNVNYILPKHLRGARDTIFASIVVPSTFLVFALFWTIFVYDRELIFPAFIDKVLTPLNNHIMHTFIVLSTFWEMLLQPRNRPKSHRRYIAHLMFHMAVYGVVIFYSYFETGVWIYPIFEKIYGTIYFYLFILLICFSALLFYYGQWILTYRIWGSKPIANVGEKKKK